MVPLINPAAIVDREDLMALVTAGSELSLAGYHRNADTIGLLSPDYSRFGWSTTLSPGSNVRMHPLRCIKSTSNHLLHQVLFNLVLVQ